MNVFQLRFQPEGSFLDRIFEFPQSVQDAGQMRALDQPALFQHDAMGAVGPNVERQKDLIRHRHFTDVASCTELDVLLRGILDQMTPPEGFPLVVHFFKNQLMEIGIFPFHFSCMNLGLISLQNEGCYGPLIAFS